MPRSSWWPLALYTLYLQDVNHVTGTYTSHKLDVSALLAPLGLAHAQYAETFDGGHNEGAYVIWFNVYNYLRATGGNPGAMLELDDFTTGSATCDQVDIAPTVWPSQFSGDYRALGLRSVGFDLNIRQGRYGGIVQVTLTSDPGTPGNTADDCSVSCS